MFLKTAAFGIINGSINGTVEDQNESFQFVVDNGYEEELTPPQLLHLRKLIEADVVFTPTLFVPTYDPKVD